MPGAQGWLSVFWELSNDRPIGFGVGPIPAASIDRRSVHMDADEAEMFRKCIRAMDAEYLKYIAEQNGQGSPNDNVSARDAFRARMG